VKTRTITFKGSVNPELKSKTDYIYLPFQVPEGTKTIKIEYTYCQNAEIDIGVIEPGSIELGKAKFRGWSGTNKKKIVISTKYSTPGYWKGEIKSGEWRIILGLYKLLEKECNYEVKITLLNKETPAPREKPKKPVKREKRREEWIKGDLHLHTIHSDGDATIEEVARKAIEKGLDFIAITDHNTITQLEEIGKLSSLPIVIIPGEEITTYYGHANFLDIKEMADFRIREITQFNKIAREHRKRGTIVSINHPKPLGPNWTLGETREIDAVECWQAIWEFNNYLSVKYWDEILSKGIRATGIGGSDAHHIKKPISEIFGLATPTTWVKSKPNKENILKAIKEGRVFISEKPTGPTLTIQAIHNGEVIEMGGQASANSKIIVKAVNAKGCVLRLLTHNKVLYIEKIDTNNYTSTLKIREKAKYVRAEITTRDTPLEEPYHEEQIVKALTNPIYLTPQQP